MDEPSAEDVIPRPPPPPVMTWEEIEDGKAGQLNFPALTPVPTVAERAFLVLAREWLAEYEAQAVPKRLTSHMGDLALACVLLSVEWGRDFSEVALNEMESNRAVAASHAHPSWMNELPWRLCQSANLMSPPQSDAVQELTANLDHHNSSIRRWMMEIAWFTAPWLEPADAGRRLLKNLADTLVWPERAAGLAAQLFKTEEAFLSFARAFVLPPREGETAERRTFITEQYCVRLEDVKKQGIRAGQASFWETAAICRKEIERAALGFRMRKRIGRTA